MLAFKSNTYLTLVNVFTKGIEKHCLTNFEFDVPFQVHLVSVKPPLLLHELLHVEWVFKNKYVFILKRMEKVAHLKKCSLME